MVALLNVKLSWAQLGPSQITAVRDMFCYAFSMKLPSSRKVLPAQQNENNTAHHCLGLITILKWGI